MDVIRSVKITHTNADKKKTFIVVVGRDDMLCIPSIR